MSKADILPQDHGATKPPDATTKEKPTLMGRLLKKLRRLFNRKRKDPEIYPLF